MDRFEAMQVFVEVARSGSFAAASRSLSRSAAGVTRAVATLEEQIGTRLFVRTTRSVKLTEAGERYYEDSRRILADLAEAEAAAAGSYTQPSGLLTVTASVLFGRLYVAPILTDFLDLHPAITVRALFLDRVTNLVEEGMDVAVRIGHLPDSSLSAMRVGQVRRVICAAPSYLSQHGIPKEPSDLLQHRIIASTSIAPGEGWRFGQDGKQSIPVVPRLLFNQNDAAIQTAEAGWGLTRVLSYQIGPALGEGRLQIVLEEFEEAPLPVHLVYADGRRTSARIRSFLDFAADRLRTHPLLNPPADRHARR